MQKRTLQITIIGLVIVAAFFFLYSLNQSGLLSARALQGGASEGVIILSEPETDTSTAADQATCQASCVQSCSDFTGDEQSNCLSLCQTWCAQDY